VTERNTGSGSWSSPTKPLKEQPNTPEKSVASVRQTENSARVHSSETPEHVPVIFISASTTVFYKCGNTIPHTPASEEQ
jgi:hypothetical protein